VSGKESSTRHITLSRSPAWATSPQDSTIVPIAIDVTINVDLHFDGAVSQS
jgi:hypothetical protein